eukprot:Pgem_evm1s19446
MSFIEINKKTYECTDVPADGCCLVWCYIKSGLLQDKELKEPTPSSPTALRNMVAKNMRNNEFCLSLFNKFFDSDSTVLYNEYIDKKITPKGVHLDVFFMVMMYVFFKIKTVSYHYYLEDNNEAYLNIIDVSRNVPKKHRHEAEDLKVIKLWFHEYGKYKEVGENFNTANHFLILTPGPSSINSAQKIALSVSSESDIETELDSETSEIQSQSAETQSDSNIDPDSSPMTESKFIFQTRTVELIFIKERLPKN